MNETTVAIHVLSQMDFNGQIMQGKTGIAGFKCRRCGAQIKAPIVELLSLPLDRGYLCNGQSQEFFRNSQPNESN